MSEPALDVGKLVDGSAARGQGLVDLSVDGGWLLVSRDKCLPQEERVELLEFG